MCFGKHPFIELDEELRLFIPRPTKEEIAQLEANIVADGEIKEPVVVWGNILVDGYTRYDIARRLDMPFHLKRREFRDNDAAKAWMLRNQLGRRNLSPDQMSLIRAELYRLTKDERERGCKNYTQGEKSAAAVAKQTGVTEKTVHNDVKYAEAVGKLDPDVREAVVNREVESTRKAVKELAEKTPAQQRKVVAKVKAGEAKTIQEVLKPKKNGQVVGWTSDRDAEISSMAGKLVRLIDERGNGTNKGAGHAACIAALRSFGDAWKSWRTGKA